jgi:hypothetical protein
VLLERLDELAAERATGEWAAEAGRLVRKLGAAATQESGEAVSIVRQLQELASEVTSLAATLDNTASARDLSRAGHALIRRLAVWEQIVQTGRPAPTTVELAQPDPRQLSLCLAEIDAMTGDSVSGKAWRKYLLVDALRECTDNDRPPDDPTARMLAQRVLNRLSQVPMSARQQQLVSSGPVAALQAELRHWAAEPRIELAELLEHLERYEKSGLGSDARMLAMDCLQLNQLAGDDQRRLAQRLEVNYRNANLRVAVTEELLDRLMPEQEPQHARVRESVLGNLVKGQSMTFTKVGVQMVPDRNHVRLALEVTGRVVSLTSSTTGPVTFYNDSTSTYTARKLLEFDLKGLRPSPTEVSVRSNSRVRKLQTSFDGIPLVGGLIRQVARSQRAKKDGEIGRELGQKVGLKVRRRIDSAADERVGQVSERLQKNIIGPLEALRLAPTLIDAETTEHRFTVRLRLAGEDQLGSHTPRPRAPSDSLVSIQVHETAINNTLQRLALDGRTFTLPELSRHVASQFNRAPFWEIDPANENVVITFARQDAVRVGLRDGRVVLDLAITKLSKSPRSWKDFAIRVFYQPRLSGRSARLVRDGTIELRGERISTGAQIALRAIFAKTFSRRRPWKLTPERIATDEKFADLAVTQFAIEDGWLGVAMGPQRTAQRPGLLRR